MMSRSISMEDFEEEFEKLSPYEKSLYYASTWVTEFENGYYQGACMLPIAEADEYIYNGVLRNIGDNDVVYLFHEPVGGNPLGFIEE